jgi:HK97 family phage portal protein
MVIGNDWTFEALQVNPQESQFIETQRLNASQIAAIYGCPPEKVGGESGGSLTYSTVELNALDFQSTTLRSWLVRLEYAISDVLPSREYMRFNLDGALRTDITTRYTAYGLALAQGWLNLDDIRALENKSPLPNGEGQKYGPAKPPQPALPAVRSAEAEAFLGMLMSERDVKHDA